MILPTGCPCPTHPAPGRLTKMSSRIVSWFSCGAASAVATKLALAKADPGREFVIAYCEIVEEHPDNMRFLRDCEEWFGREVVILGNDKYKRSIFEVFRKTRFLKGPQGARCTGELKKAVRHKFQEPDDLIVFGYTVEEKRRLTRFREQNFDVDIWPTLIEAGLSKQDCLAMIDRAGIELPAMYKLGYRNNNCIGCVKGEAGYWNKIRVDFPETFERMSAMEEELGRTVCKRERKDGRDRIPLSELPTGLGNYSAEADISCSIFCAMAEDEFNGTGDKPAKDNTPVDTEGQEVNAEAAQLASPNDLDPEPGD